MSKPASFEKSVAELEAIVNQLEKGDLALGDALKYFEKGILLARKCEDMLRDAEQKVEILSQGSTPYDVGDSDDR